MSEPTTATHDEGHGPTIGPVDIERMVEDHLPLLHAIASGWRARCRGAVEHRDLVQCGAVGLVEAARRYDPSCGASFATFAARRIRGAIADHLRSIDPLTRTRRHAIRELDGARRDLRARLGREPERQEVARHLGWSDQGLEQARGDQSALDRGWAAVRCAETSDAVPEMAVASSEPSPYEALAAAELRGLTVAALDDLPERERLVLALSYLETAPYTLKEIGEIMGVTESRVCQLRGRALGRLRATLERALGRESARAC
jgi:RNA polymerase sigma factor for flagellar operon FliA